MTVNTDSLRFEDHFTAVEDPRINRTKVHELLDILFICVVATIAGADGPTDIADFAKQREIKGSGAYIDKPAKAG